MIASGEYNDGVEKRIKQIMQDIGLNNFTQVNNINVKISKRDSLAVFYKLLPLTMKTLALT